LVRGRDSGQFLPRMSRMLEILLLCFVLIIVLACIIYYVIYYNELNESPSMAYIFNTVRTTDASGGSDFDVSGFEYSKLFYRNPYKPAYEPVYFITAQNDVIEKEQAARSAPSITFNSLLSSENKTLNYPFD
jgi:hypothetical protein